MKAFGLVIVAVGLLGLATTAAYAEAGQSSDQELRAQGIPNIRQQQRIERNRQYRDGVWMGERRSGRGHDGRRHKRKHYRY
jgi:Tfp pilus assembly protein PilV